MNAEQLIYRFENETRAIVSYFDKVALDMEALRQVNPLSMPPAYNYGEEVEHLIERTNTYIDGLVLHTMTWLLAAQRASKASLSQSGDYTKTGFYREEAKDIFEVADETEIDSIMADLVGQPQEVLVGYRSALKAKYHKHPQMVDRLTKRSYNHEEQEADTVAYLTSKASVLAETVGNHVKQAITNLKTDNQFNQDIQERLDEIVLACVGKLKKYEKDYKRQFSL